MKCERSVITITLHWHSSQIFSLGNCVDDTPTETRQVLGQLNAQTVTGHLHLKTRAILSTMILRIRTYRRDLKENRSFLACMAERPLDLACMAHPLMLEKSC